MKYRMGTVEDKESLTKLRLAFLETDFGTLNEGDVVKMQQTLPAYFEQHLGKDLLIYVAEDEKRIVATAFLVMIEKPSNPHFITGRIGEILNVYTEPEYRRRGIAKQLLERMIDDAKKEKLSYLELSATKDGYPLYKKLGFMEQQAEYVEMKYYIKEDIDGMTC